MPEDFRIRVGELSRQVGLTNHADAIAAVALECAGLVPTAPAPTAPLGAPRFGGNPDLPPGAEWPRDWREALYSFVLQIDLGCVPSMADSPLPADGLLSLFTGENDETYDFSHLVIYTPPGPLVRVAPPAGVPFADPRLGATQPVSMQIHRAIALPNWKSDELDELDLDEAEVDCYFQLHALLQGPAQPSTLLGYPNSPNGAIGLAGGNVLLFLVYSHPAPKLNWWDAGILHVLAPRADLEARVFDHTVVGVYTS